MPVRRVMSDAELTKFEILRDVDHERMPVRAAQVLGLTERQSLAPLEGLRTPRRRRRCDLSRASARSDLGT
jgi:hypothetical protein